MPTDQDKQELDRVREANEQLTASLKRCRSLLDDCRSKLAANSNEEWSADELGGSEGGDSASRTGD